MVLEQVNSEQEILLHVQLSYTRLLLYICTYACMHVCMYLCMYVCMYVCMYTYMDIYNSKSGEPVPTLL